MLMMRVRQSVLMMSKTVCVNDERKTVCVNDE